MSAISQALRGPRTARQTHGRGHNAEGIAVTLRWASESGPSAARMQVLLKTPKHTLQSLLWTELLGSGRVSGEGYAFERIPGCACTRIISGGAWLVEAC